MANDGQTAAVLRATAARLAGRELDSDEADHLLAIFDESHGSFSDRALTALRHFCPTSDDSTASDRAGEVMLHLSSALAKWKPTE